MICQGYLIVHLARPPRPTTQGIGTVQGWISVLNSDPYLCSLPNPALLPCGPRGLARLALGVRVRVGRESLQSVVLGRPAVVGDALIFYVTLAIGSETKRPCIEVVIPSAVGEFRDKIGHGQLDVELDHVGDRVELDVYDLVGQRHETNEHSLGGLVLDCLSRDGYWTGLDWTSLWENNEATYIHEDGKNHQLGVEAY